MYNQNSLTQKASLLIVMLFVLGSLLAIAVTQYLELFHWDAVVFSSTPAPTTTAVQTASGHAYIPSDHGVSAQICPEKALVVMVSEDQKIGYTCNRIDVPQEGALEVKVLFEKGFMQHAYEGSWGTFTSSVIVPFSYDGPTDYSLWYHCDDACVVKAKDDTGEPLYRNPDQKVVNADVEVRFSVKKAGKGWIEVAHEDWGGGAFVNLILQSVELSIPELAQLKSTPTEIPTDTPVPTETPIPTETPLPTAEPLHVAPPEISGNTAGECGQEAKSVLVISPYPQPGDLVLSCPIVDEIERGIEITWGGAQADDLNLGGPWESDSLTAFDFAVGIYQVRALDCDDACVASIWLPGGIAVCGADLIRLGCRVESTSDAAGWIQVYHMNTGGSAFYRVQLVLEE